VNIPSFKKPSKADIKLMNILKKRWNPKCSRQNFKDIKILKQKQGNFTLCIIEYPCKSKIMYFTGISKRNPCKDIENFETGAKIALSRACKDLFARWVSPAKKKKVVEVEEFLDIEDNEFSKEFDSMFDDIDIGKQDEKVVDLDAEIEQEKVFEEESAFPNLP